MSDILCITNRKLCKTDFLKQVEGLAAARPAGIVLREKDLTKEEYTALAKEVLKICRSYNTPCILHGFFETALKLQPEGLHLPLPVLKEYGLEPSKRVVMLGASCHSADEAKTAQALGCNYITAGHIFETDCKKGLTGRGIRFLAEVCQSVDIPVYAIGGISPNNIAEVRSTGAAGACVMSGCMTCENPEQYLKSFEVKI